MWYRLRYGIISKDKPWLMTADMRWTSTKRLIFVGLVIALELTGMRLPAARWGQMVIFIPRWVVSFVIEVGMFRWTSGVYTSGGPILRQLCLDRLHPFLLSLVLVVDWYIPILNGQPSSTVVNFHITFNIVVVWAYSVGSTWSVYETQKCASYHIVQL